MNYDSLESCRQKRPGARSRRHRPVVRALARGARRAGERGRQPGCAAAGRAAGRTAAAGWHSPPVHSTRHNCRRLKCWWSAPAFRWPILRWPQAIAAGVEVVGDVELFARAIAAINAQRATTPESTARCGDCHHRQQRQEHGHRNVRRHVPHGRDCKPASPAISACRCWTPCMKRNRVKRHAAGVGAGTVQFPARNHVQPQRHAATVLNVSEDHMDRYADMAAYAAAKARIFSGNGVQVLNRDDSAHAGDGLARAPRRQLWTGSQPA